MSTLVPTWSDNGYQKAGVPASGAAVCTSAVPHTVAITQAPVSGSGWQRCSRCGAYVNGTNAA